MTTTLTNQRILNIALVMAGIVSATMAVLVWRDNKRHQVMEKELIDIDKEIKLLQLSTERKKNGIP